MITVRDIEQFLYDWAPPETAESWDNVGLLVGPSGPAGPAGAGGAGRNARRGGGGQRSWGRT